MKPSKFHLNLYSYSCFIYLFIYMFVCFLVGGSASLIHCAGYTLMNNTNGEKTYNGVAREGKKWRTNKRKVKWQPLEPRPLWPQLNIFNKCSISFSFFFLFFLLLSTIKKRKTFSKFKVVHQTVVCDLRPPIAHHRHSQHSINVSFFKSWWLSLSMRKHLKWRENSPSGKFTFFFFAVLILLYLFRFFILFLSYINAKTVLVEER